MRRWLAATIFAICSSCGSDPETVSTGFGRCDAELAQGSVQEINSEPSCALQCGHCEEEADAPWKCGALEPWSKLVHDCSDSACGKWDGRYPEVTPGKCTVSEPSGEAVAKTDSKGTPVVLPDGRRLVPVGVERLLEHPDTKGTFPASALWLPGTRFVVVSDNGYGDHALRILDATKLAADQDPITSQLVYPRPESLNWGLALAPDGTLYASSGKPDSIIRAYTVAANGELTATPQKNIPVENSEPGDVFPSGIAVSPDGTKLAVAQAQEQFLLIYALDAAKYGTQLAAIDLGKFGLELLATRFDPQSSSVVYVTAWNGSRLFEVNIESPASPGVKEIPTGRQPEQLAFISPTHLVVTNSMSDDLSIVDRTSAQVVATVPIDAKESLNGLAPSALAFDAASSRLFVTLAGVNAVAAFEVAVPAGQAPTLKLLGYLPTGWWPTAVAVADAPAGDPLAGSIMVLNGRGRGIGPEPPLGEDVYAMKGSAQLIQDTTVPTLESGTSAWQAAEDVGKLPGHPTVSCPAGEDDFPVPPTNEQGASSQIEHVMFIVRENKTFDALMGDMPGVDGDPSLVMKPGKMDQVWGNIRKVAKEFAHADNFYEDAEQSLQGHYWTVHGRSSDFLERSWFSIWGRSTRLITSVASASAGPEEGGIFHWLEANGVAFDNMGELFNAAKGDVQFGLVTTENAIPDTKGACYLAARARLTCNLKPFTYVWLVNDHTLGGTAGSPNPTAMIAVNDEATGMIIDAVSHSPQWKSSLIVVIEDDPSDGADHVDTHRSIAVFASPWVKRGYVTKTHFDVSSLHKLFAHIFGLPYNNRQIAKAALPLDLFTSTPDYTPYTYLPRTWTDLSCNPPSSPYAIEAAARGWDFSDPDDQPGLADQVWRMLRADSEPRDEP